MARHRSIAASLAEPVTPPAPAAEPESPAPAARKKRAPRKTAPPAPAGEPEQQDDKPRTDPPRILFPPQGQVEGRVSLKLHAEDLRAMGEAKLDDRVDHNQRIRAMVAVWRANPRFRTQVDRLARTSPKGLG